MAYGPEKSLKLPMKLTEDDIDVIKRKYSNLFGPEVEANFRRWVRLNPQIVDPVIGPRDPNNI